MSGVNNKNIYQEKENGIKMSIKNTVSACSRHASYIAAPAEPEVAMDQIKYGLPASKAGCHFPSWLWLDREVEK